MSNEGFYFLSSKYIHSCHPTITALKAELSNTVMLQTTPKYVLLVLASKYLMNFQNVLRIFSINSPVSINVKPDVCTGSDCCGRGGGLERFHIISLQGSKKAIATSLGTTPRYVIEFACYSTKLYSASKNVKSLSKQDHHAANSLMKDANSHIKLVYRLKIMRQNQSSTFEQNKLLA